MTQVANSMADNFIMIDSYPDEFNEEVTRYYEVTHSIQYLCDLIS